MSALIDPSQPIMPPPMNEAEEAFTSLISARRAGLNFKDEARYFTEQWMRHARAGMMSVVPLTEVHAEFLKAAQLGLSYAPEKMQAFCIANFDIDTGFHRPVFYLGYKGMYQLIAQDRNIAYTHTEIIFENDTFQDNGPAAVPDHKRVINPNKRGGIIGGYAYSVLIAGGHTICTTVDSDVMQEIEGNAIANGSQAWNSPFVNEMRRKTITRRHFDDLLPVLNLNVELEPSNIHAENSFEAEYARHGK